MMGVVLTRCSSHCILSRGAGCQYDSFVVMLALITWVRWCPPGSSVEESYLKVLKSTLSLWVGIHDSSGSSGCSAGFIESMVQFKDEEWVPLKHGSNLNP